MNKLLPYEKYYLKTSLSFDTIHHRINNNTLTAKEYVEELNKNFSRFGYRWSNPYWGYINEKGFELTRLLNYKNPSNPKIFGTKTDAINETVIRIVMRPKGYVLVFFGLALVLCLIAFFHFLIKAFRESTLNDELILSAGMTIVVYLFLLVPFKMEAVKSKKFLRDLLEAD